MAHTVLLTVIYLAFISLGLPDGVLGVAWPAMRGGFGEPLEAAGLITLVVTACAAVSGFASGAVLQRLGTGPVVVISGFLTGLALLGFAAAPSFLWILVLSVPLGLGAGSVDAGLNHFVARHYSSRHMNWLHGCWGIGASIGPLIMGAALAHPGGWTQGYHSIASLQLGLSVVFLFTLALWKREPLLTLGEQAGGSEAARHSVAPPWAAWLAPSLYLLYATVEVGTGLWAASILVEKRGLAARDAAVWLACFYAAIMGGRFALGLIAVRLGNRRLVHGGLALALFGASLFAVPALPPALTLAGLVLLGLGAAPIYPSLMHETTRRFDAVLARRVVGRQVAFASLGAAIGPALLGLLGAQLGLHAILPMVVLVLLLLWLLVWRLDKAT